MSTRAAVRLSQLSQQHHGARKFVVSLTANVLSECENRIFTQK